MTSSLTRVLTRELELRSGEVKFDFVSSWLMLSGEPSELATEAV